MGYPNFFILGAPKCGTTALAQWLGEHPNIYMSSIKEPHYYSTDLKDRQAWTQRQYDRLFEDVNEKHAAVGEASVWYLYSQDAVANILKDVSEARFIVCLRNPAEMAYSLHGQHLLSGHEHIRDFDLAWRSQPLRAEGKSVCRTCVDSRLLLYGPVCSLGEQMARLLAMVSHERVLPIFLDDMRRDAGACYRDALQFLNVPDDGREEFPVVNAARQRRYRRLWGVILAINAGRRKLGIPGLGTGIMPMISRWSSTPKKREPLDSVMREELRRYFIRDIRNLEHLLGRDLGAWKT